MPHIAMAVALLLLLLVILYTEPVLHGSVYNRLLACTYSVVSCQHVYNNQEIYAVNEHVLMQLHMFL
jgi:hypothetical protein